MFKVLKNLRHDGTDYQIGDTLEIDIDRGIAMVESGILELIGDGKPKESIRLQRDSESELAEVKKEVKVKKVKKVK